MRHVARRIALVALAAAATVAVIATAALADQSYSDPTGDGKGGEDVTGVSVTNTQDGALSFTVTLASPLAPGHAIFLFIDGDRNAGTGAEGDEHLLVVGPTLFGWATWDGSTYAVGSGLPAGFGAGGLSSPNVEIHFNSSAIGSPSGFDFDLYTASLDSNGQPVWYDGAPDQGKYSYDLTFPQCSNGKDDDGDGKVDASDLGCSGTTDDNEADDPVTIKLGAAKTAPARPAPGRVAVVSVAATRVETGQPLDGGTVACSAKVTGGKTLRGTGSMLAGRASCRFKIPASAAKHVVRGQVSVTYQSASAKAPFSFRVAG